MEGASGELFIVVLMGVLCAAFVFLLIRSIRNKAVGARNVLRIIRIVICGLGAIWFGYVFINLLVILPQILAG